MSVQTKIVLTLGELLWDRFPEGRRPGGAPANVAFHATQLGLRGEICSRVGDDPDGLALLEELAARGVSTRLVQRDSRLETGTVTVDLRDPAGPRYHIDENVAWDAIEFEPRLSRAIREAAVVYVGTLAQRSERSRATIRQCLDTPTDALHVYDANLRPGGDRWEWIEETLHRADIVKLNLAEASRVGVLIGAGSPEPAVIGRELIRQYGVEMVSVTRGDHGCVLVTADEVADHGGERAEVQDAVGAGDAFTAALISARLRGFTLDRAAAFANSVGALVASRKGAMPDLTGELGTSG